MFTQEDLSNALILLEQRTPDVEHILVDRAVTASHRQQRIRHSAARGWLAPVCAAAAVLAVAAAAMGLATVGDRKSHSAAAGQQPSAPPHAVALSFDFRIDALAGFHMQPEAVAADYQDAMGVYDGPDAPQSIAFDIRVFNRGAYDPSEAKSGAAVQVNGRPGYYGQLATPGGGAFATLTWEYAPNSWANVQQGGPAVPKFKTIALSVAKAIHFNVSARLPLPFRFGYLPAHLVPVSALSMPYFSPGDGELVFGDELVASDPTRGAIDIDLHPTPPPGSMPLCPTGAPSFEAAGYRGCRFKSAHSANLHYLLQVPGGRLEITVDSRHASRYTDDEVRKIISGMTFARSIADSSTWFDGKSVLP